MLYLQETQTCLSDQQEPGQALASKKPGLKILVAEDNELNATTMLAILRKAGHQPSLAENGRKALEMWSSEPWDCIVMDIQMPEMDGILVTTTIRSQEQQVGGHVPIIALTALALSGDKDRLLAEGFDSYLSKPVDAKTITDEIRRVTERPALAGC